MHPTQFSSSTFRLREARQARGLKTRFHSEYASFGFLSPSGALINFAEFIRPFHYCQEI